MTEPSKEKIAFDVETSRVLQILSSEIYDSPKAFLRENVQNAYDAILMRCKAENLLPGKCKIDIIIKSNQIIVHDDGIGMTEDVLKNNFWKAGSSGKKTELAQSAGVIGTFGIGAMANFGVCTMLRVETRSIQSEVTLISSAVRDKLKIAQECVDLERVTDKREPGTRIIADIDPANSINEADVCEYLGQYVSFLPVPVHVNGNLISQKNFADTLSSKTKGFKKVSSVDASHGAFSGKLSVLVNGQNLVLVHLTDIKLNETLIRGEGFFVQGSGAIHGFRNWFGLAPVPVSGYYGFDGFINLDILHPTAGREALSRESIQHVVDILAMIEFEVSNIIAVTSTADVNRQFQQYILSNNLIDLARNVKIQVRPADDTITLGDILTYQPDKNKRYYKGRDGTILNFFSDDQTNLFYVSRENPRRNLQIRYLKKIKLQEVDDKPKISKIIPKSELTFEEVMFLVKLRSILLDDYMLPDSDVEFAEITHGVSFYVEEIDSIVQIRIVQTAPSVMMVLECYETAPDVFNGFMKDFVREHIYPRIRDYVPSSTKQGRDALYKRLKENKELFSIKEDEYGEIDPLVTDFLEGKTEFSDVIKASRGLLSVQRQQVSREHVGRVEDLLPDISDTVSSSPQKPSALEVAPPIMRYEFESNKKVLMSNVEHPGLNNFKMFLAVSDRMMKQEGEFLRWPHTTKVIWASHRVIYIFTDATGGISLYYDIELKSPLEKGQTGGAMFPTTTIVTKNRIFIPVPKELEPTFQVTDEVKEFYVRFDTLLGE